MTIRMRVQMLGLAAAVVAATCLVRAQQPSSAVQTSSSPAASSARTAPLTQQIPADPQITIGKFQNGLHYYIRANQQPEHRAELRLVVNAGSNLEDDDQQGLAHFVEHMAFSGTTHFPKQDVVNFMQSIGMKFGAHVNAYTSFDETVYMLQVPTDKPEVLNKALLILEDWAHNVTFDPAEIDKERQVITEEWRLGRGAGARLQDKEFPVLLKGSRYADRLPIGKMDIVQNFKRDRLTKFYADWYRPDLMAVVAVGDFDKAAVETLIKDHFSTIPSPSSPRPRPVFTVPDHAGTVYAIATDKEATTTTVDVYGLMPAREQSTIGAYRRQIVEGLFSGLLSGRFDEMSQKPGAPFLGASASRGAFVRTEEASTLNALVKDDGVEAGLDALFSEAERVTRFGFTATEFERQKKVLLADIDQAAGEKDKQPSSALASEYIRNFLTNEPIPGIAYEAELYHRFLPEITLNEINALAKDWTPDHDRAVVISAPQKEGLTLPDEAKLAAVMKAAGAKDLKPYIDTGDTQPLLDPLPTPGIVLRTTPANAFGITEWELSNGVKVVLKPTTFKEDEIVFRAAGLGGTSLASDKDFIAANTATQVISASGLGKFSGLDLPKQLAGKVASAQPFIGDTDQGLSGNASRKDLETMFQLIYLTVTEPRADPAMFGVITSQTKTLLANETAAPEFAYSEALIGALTQNHPRARMMTPALVDEMDLDKSFMFYKDRFADASNLTFTFVGSFDLPTIKPLVERYLATLPTLHRNQSFRDTGPHPPKGIVEKRVEKGIEPKSQAAIVFTGPFQYNQVQRVAIRAMAQVMENQLREVLREDLGGTYSVSVSSSYDKFPTEDYTLGIEFGCDPKRTDDLVKTVFDQIALLKTKGPTDQQVADVKAALLRDVETNFKQNGYLLSQISLRYEYGESLDSLFGISEYYNKLTPAMVQDAAKTYFNTDNYVKVTLFPEKKQ